MTITTIRTEKVTTTPISLETFLDRYIPPLKERSVIVITSKVIALLEGSHLPKRNVNKRVLIQQEADHYLLPRHSALGFILTIKNGTLIPSAGIDESNVQDSYVLWPKDPFKTARAIWRYLKKRDTRKSLGVLITDSKTTPLRWGTTGISIAWCGFDALNTYIGKPDIFGRLLRVTKANIADGLAAAAVVQMGEGEEQTPIALIEDLEFVTFRITPPSRHTIDEFYVSLQMDLYAPILSSVSWCRGGSGRAQ